MPKTSKAGVPLSKAEVRHNKQKEKLNNADKDENKYVFVPQKTLKLRVYEDMISKGYICVLTTDNILMFNSSDKEAVTAYLSEHYAVDNKIPFSYGFGGNINVFN